ncbi:hypothetical protein HYPSUDRAFT_181664 [Hypholoma sublateritium FD-334 SS-4]|uniref:GP-PDE domain-containing protein n=1 Tax=Hypholoma sublateritium (strain FD-334 SS-4) TaxID=945553 RepID=A0A0D2PC20_HYPSF|nr:hypothetical protein HYPSUDRAFT_181664 [Hypholoma sublateritium FD-334 SS-4]
MKAGDIFRYAAGLLLVYPVLGGAFQARFSLKTFFDLQGHRGSRGENSESLLPAFAWGLIDGVTTLELDNGITKDGAVIVWHDEEILADKCSDTAPLFSNDPNYPYVGKHIANLTLAQIKTLDCGSKRQYAYPLQLTYPGTKISTLSELFQFAKCADPKRTINWNIESKINPVVVNATRSVEDFVTLQNKEFVKSGYKLSQITYQSFDWRTLVGMKVLNPRIPTSALIDEKTVFGAANSTSPWHGGIRIQDLPGATTGEKIVHAAKSIAAAIISPTATEDGVDPTDVNWVPFTTIEMVRRAHEFGILVKPFTVNRLNIAQVLLEAGVDGIITDYPATVRRFLEANGESLPPQFPATRVLNCLSKHLQSSRLS